jgi:hypothetical protein
MNETKIQVDRKRLETMITGSSLPQLHHKFKNLPGIQVNPQEKQQKPSLPVWNVKLRPESVGLHD